MDVIKSGGGNRNPRRYRSTDVSPVQAKRRKNDEESSDELLPSRIEILKHGGPLAAIVPGHVWRTRAFKWNPVTFATESEQLNSKFVEPNVQDNSLTMFLRDTQTPMIYGVSGNPDDTKAKYFAAYLISQHLKHLGAAANVVWETVYGGFDNQLLTATKSRPTMLVISNLTPNSTGTKLEKTRDLIEAFPDIPRVIVIAGIDPLSFLTTRLYVPANGIAYFSEALVKQKIEII